MASLNWYEVLGVKSECSKEDIKKAYKRLILKCHPDRPGGDEELFGLITEAYTVLSNDANRAEYDKSYKNAIAEDEEYNALKQKASEYMKAQKSKVTQTEKDQFRQMFEELNKKHGYDPKKAQDKITVGETKKTMEQIVAERTKQEMEVKPEMLFDPSERFDNDKFQEAFKLMNKTSTELIRHNGNPSAWNGDCTGSFCSLDTADNLYNDDTTNLVSDMYSSNRDVDVKKDVRLTKADMRNLKGDEDTHGHKNKSPEYQKELEQKIRELEQQTEQLKTMAKESKLDMGGYGISQEVGITPTLETISVDTVRQMNLSSRKDKDKFGKLTPSLEDKYQKMLRDRNNIK